MVMCDIRGMLYAYIHTCLSLHGHIFPKPRCPKSHTFSTIHMILGFTDNHGSREVFGLLPEVQVNDIHAGQNAPDLLRACMLIEMGHTLNLNGLSYSCVLSPYVSINSMSLISVYTCIHKVQCLVSVRGNRFLASHFVSVACPNFGMAPKFQVGSVVEFRSPQTSPWVAPRLPQDGPGMAPTSLQEPSI